MEIILKYFSGLSEQQIIQFEALDNLYRLWNKKINVISRKDITGLYEKHILHSLSIAAVFDFKAGTEILDIGTGGGFPGIPLAIFFPLANFHLIDSINKKLNVVQAVAESIGLKNINTSHIRAEEIKNRKYDFVVSRAVAPLKDLWNWSKPLLKKFDPDITNESHLTVSSGQEGGQISEGNPTHRTPVILSVANDTTHTVPDFNKTENPGLIALKGGNLIKEIQQSGIKPHIIGISGIFPEEFFKEKYLLYVPSKTTA